MGPHHLPSDTWTQFALSVFHLNGLLVEAGETISRSAGQSSARWQVLGSISTPQTAAQIARQLGLARQSVQRVAEVLEREGLILGTDHPNDRRTRLLSLTPQGKDVLSAIYSRQLAWSHELLTRLDAEQLTVVTGALQDIARVLKADTHPRQPKKQLDIQAGTSS